MEGVPSWVHQAEARRRARVASLQAAADAAKISVPVRDSFHTAPGYREIGMEFTTGEGESFRDPAVTKAIRVFDPTMIPVWVRWAFLSPSDTGEPKLVVFGRHGIARYVEDPHGELPPFPIIRSLYYDGPLPNKLELILEGEKDPRYSDLPGKFVPWDWALHARLRAAYNVWSVREAKRKFVTEVLEARERAAEKRRAEEAYVRADLDRYATRKLEQVSEVEMKERFLGGPEIKKKVLLDLGS